MERIQFTAKQIEVMKIVEAIMKLIELIFGGGFTAKESNAVRNYIEYTPGKPLELEPLEHTI